MAMPPLAYNLRSLLVRRTSTLLTVVGIGATVAVLAGILSLQQGFAALYEEGGREDVVIFMRPGATSEGAQFDQLKMRLTQIGEDLGVHVVAIHDDILTAMHSV